jgi:hypothetical protein
MARIVVEGIGNGVLIGVDGVQESKAYFARTWGEVVRWMIDLNGVVGLQVEADGVAGQPEAGAGTGLDYSALERASRRVVQGLRGMLRRPSGIGSDELVAAIDGLESVLLGGDERVCRPELSDARDEVRGARETVEESGGRFESAGRT